MTDHDNIESTLVNHRFAFSRESLRMMKSVRDVLPDLQTKYPHLAGVAWFGSRTRGTERNDPKQKSDLDMIIFFDGSAAQVDHKYQRIVNDQVKSNLVGEFLTFFRHNNIPYNTDNALSTFDTYISPIIVVDISPEETARAVQSFQRWVDSHSNNQTGAYTPSTINNHHVLPIVSRFMFGVGDRLYQNRTQVLDMLESMPNGERYLKALMQNLEYIERYKKGVPQYDKLPTTINQARKYFAVRDEAAQIGSLQNA